MIEVGAAIWAVALSVLCAAWGARRNRCTRRDLTFLLCAAAALALAGGCFIGAQLDWGVA
jgi:hypothetical protein